MSCELCGAERLTEWLHEDDICWIAKCKTCHNWMVVLKEHKDTPSHRELVHIKKIVTKYFGIVHFRGYARATRDHYHEHILE